MQLLEILLPVVSPVYSWRAIGGVETNTLRTVETPATNIELARCLVGQNNSSRAEDVRLDVHCPPREVKVIGE